MPSPAQLQEIFDTLVGNSLDFFERSAQEFEKEHKFSVAHFATGLELLLKARLFREHWTLIALEPHKCAWSSIKDGTVRTVPAADLCAAISTTTSTPLQRERDVFKAIFDHRNRVLHWAPKNDLTSTVVEQGLAWYYVRALLNGAWADVFAPFAWRIEQVERLLHEHRSYLETKFKKLKPSLTKARKAGLLLQCPACEFEAGEAADRGGRVLALECRVCEYSTTVFRAASGVLELRDHDEMLEELVPTPMMKPKELMSYQPNVSYCGVCLEGEPTVAPDGPEYVCVACAARFDPNDSASCDWCSDRWFGWNAEHSFYTGCEHCDGHQPRD